MPTSPATITTWLVPTFVWRPSGGDGSQVRGRVAGRGAGQCSDCEPRRPAAHGRWEPPPASGERVEAGVGVAPEPGQAYMQDAAELFELGRQAERARREPPYGLD